MFKALATLAALGGVVYLIYATYMISYTGANPFQ